MSEALRPRGSASVKIEFFHVTVYLIPGSGAALFSRNGEVLEMRRERAAEA